MQTNCCDHLPWSRTAGNGTQTANNNAPPPPAPWRSPLATTLGSRLRLSASGHPRAYSRAVAAPVALATTLTHLLWPRDAPGILASLWAFWNVFRFNSLKPKLWTAAIEIPLLPTLRPSPPAPPRTLSAPSGMHSCDCDRTDIPSQNEQVVAAGF